MKQQPNWMQKAKQKILLKFWLSGWQLNRIMSNRKRFEAFVYTKLEDALEILKERDAIEVDFDLPEVFQGEKKAVLFRQLVTPNFEVIRFLNIVPSALKPMFLEYHEDKYTSNNEWKYFLGKISFHQGLHKNGVIQVSKNRIIDFHESDGKKISEIVTHWGQSLIKLHHDLFHHWNNNKHDVIFFDVSDWLSQKKAKDYYELVLCAFIKHGILFENFMLESRKEKAFIKNVFLPAFMKVWVKTGYKPLIVSLEPTTLEGEKFWYFHAHENKALLEKIIKSV